MPSPLPVPASGSGGLGMGHPHHCESPNLLIFEFLTVQEGAEPFPAMYPRPPVLVPGCGKLGRGLLHLEGWEWDAQTIMSPQILTDVIEPFHHLGRDRTVPVPYLLSFLELRDWEGEVGIWGLAVGHFDNDEPQTLVCVIEHFSSQEGVESFLVTYPPFLILTPGFEGSGMGHSMNSWTPNPHHVTTCSQGGAELYPVTHPPLLTPIPG